MKKFLNIGIIGSNEGNGHPISFSSIFNGYNEKYLSKFCKFELIKQYLPKFHKNKKSNIIQGAKSIIFGLNRKLTPIKFLKLQILKIFVILRGNV